MDIALVVIALLLFVVGPVVVVNRDLLFNRSGRRRSHAYEPPLPFLIIPTSPGASDIHPAGTIKRRAESQRLPPVAEPEEEPFGRYEDEPERSFGNNHGAAESEPREQAITREPLADVRGGVRDADQMDEPAPDATVVFHRPMDEAVQILPGKLRVLSGESAGKDFPLVSRIGEAPQLLVGRDTGPPYRHITLQAPTVSRRHARMDFIDGHWTITNLSETNPVLVNNRALLNGGSARRLSNGDCIELGEVALRFLAS